MLRPCAKLGDSSKLTPRRLPPCEGFSEAASPRRFGGVTNAYPVENQDVRGPAAPLPLTPRPPAEGPEGRSARRRHAGAGATAPEERKVATSLPPVPLTAREARPRDEFGASGSSMASGASARRPKDPKERTSERRKPPMPKAPSPKDEVSSRASSSQGRPSSGAPALWDLDLAPELFTSELGEVLAENAESSEQANEDLDPFSAELGRARGSRPQTWNEPSSSFVQVLEEMEREKELWHEKTMALLSSTPNLSTAPGSTSTSSTAPTAATAATPVPDPSPVDEELAEAEMDELPEAEMDELPSDEPQPSLIAQALRDAGLDPEETSFMDMDLSSETLTEAPRTWRSSSKSWAAQVARRKKERCSSGRATPCSGRETPEHRL